MKPIILVYVLISIILISILIICHKKHIFEGHRGMGMGRGGMGRGGMGRGIHGGRYAFSGYPYWAIHNDWYYPYWNGCNKETIINNCIDNCKEGKDKCSECFDKYC